MKLSASRLADHLSGSLADLYLIAGDEPLLVDEAADQIRRRARDDGFDERERHVAAAGFDWDGLLASGANMSLFASRRLIELRLPTGKPGQKGGRLLAELAANKPDDTCIMIFTPKLGRDQMTAKWVKAVEKHGVLVQVWPVSASELPRWIDDRMRRRGLNPVGDAVAILADRVQGNLLAAEQEIEKLRLALGEADIDAEAVARSVADSARFDVFALADSALLGDASRALRILDGLRSEGVEGTLIVWALAREARTLAAILTAVDNGTSLERAMAAQRVWSNRTTMTARAVRRVRSKTRAGEVLALAAQCDAAVKGQLYGVDPWERLTALVVALCHPERPWPDVA
ncbi:MAG: DNA polymerase III subunit delta [Pseudomonadota bacterium]